MTDQPKIIRGKHVTLGPSREVQDELTVEVYQSPDEPHESPEYVCVTIMHGGQAHPFMLDPDEAEAFADAVADAAAELRASLSSHQENR